MAHSPIKIMNKHYHFVNAAGDKIIVNPMPMGHEPSGKKRILMRTLDADTRQWKRKFAVIDSKNHADWKDIAVVDTLNYRDMPEITLNGNKWTLAPIEGIKAHRVRRTRAQIEADRAAADAAADAEDNDDDVNDAGGTPDVTPVVAAQVAQV